MRLSPALAVALALGCGAPAAGPDAAVSKVDAAIRSAASWLWAQQADDGGWHSDTYGVLKSGQSLTPFVFSTLRDVPGTLVGIETPHYTRARRFIEEHVDGDGALGRADPSLEDYPNYATSLGVVALMKSDPGGALVRRMEDCLRRQQFTEAMGWTPEHKSYGAWGMGGPLRKPPHAGQVDLSMTRYALEALAAREALPSDPAFAKARVFVDRCRKPDGGFFFSAVVPGANKAGPDGDVYRAYGTATADGLLSLLAMGVPATDPRVVGARDWLVRNHRTGRVPGIDEDPLRDWGLAMVHYYRAASARALRALDVREAPAGADWREAMIDAVVADQQPDGSFRSGDFLMKEDDPLIATTLALTALLAARE